MEKDNVDDLCVFYVFHSCCFSCAISSGKALFNVDLYVSPNPILITPTERPINAPRPTELFEKKSQNSLLFFRDRLCDLPDHDRRTSSSGDEQCGSGGSNRRSDGSGKSRIFERYHVDAQQTAHKESQTCSGYKRLFRHFAVHVSCCKRTDMFFAHSLSQRRQNLRPTVGITLRRGKKSPAERTKEIVKSQN